MAETKRPLYFMSQFLIDRDFIAEQDYHTDLRRLHNISLHTWGIVNGLEVKATSTPGQVAISAGMAIDSLGREIVIIKDLAPQFVTVNAGTSSVITIRYTEDFLPEDKYTGAGLTDKFTRATPRPKVEGVASAPDDGSVIKLAQVTVAAGGQITVDNSMRRLASSLIGTDSDLVFDTLSLTGNLSIGAGKEIFFADNGQIRSQTDGHRLVFNRVANLLELHESGDIRFLTGSSISEKMRINAAGNVGVGTATPGQKLDVSGNIKMSGVRTKLFYRGDSDAQLGSLAFYSPNGGVTAIITPYDGTGGNLANSTIQFGGFGSFDTNTVNLNVSGKVGIGMNNPLSGLSLSGDSEKLDSGNEFAPLGIYRKNTVKALLEGYHSTGEYAYIQSLERNVAVRPLALQPSGGNVGIGVTSPGRKLVVDGSATIFAGNPGNWGEGLRIIGKGSDTFAATFYGRADEDGKALWFTGIGSFPDNNRESDMIFLAGPGRGAPDTTQFTTSSLGGVYRSDAVMVLEHSTGNALFGSSVGIGTPTPGEALEVNGRIKAGALTIGPWPVNANYAFFGANALDHTNGGNYALLQSGGGSDKGITYLNSPENIRFRIGNGERMILTKEGNVGIGTTTPDDRLDIEGNVRINDKDMWLRGGADVNHGIGWYGPGKPFATKGLDGPVLFGFSGGALGTTNGGQRMALRWDSAGNVEVDGAIRAGNSDIYFTETNHNHTGTGNAAGFAAIENSVNFGALMILGRTMGSGNALNRTVKLWDSLEVNGPLSVLGNITATGNIIGHGVKGGYVGDQFVNKIGETLELGDVVVIGENQSSLYYGVNDNIPIPEVDLARTAYDTRVCGIVSQVHAELSSETKQTEEAGSTDKNAPQAKASKGRSKAKLHPRTFTAEELKEMDATKIETDQLGWMVTLGAFAHCKVDADIAPINVGDLLTTSPTKGHAQKVLDPSKATGAIIGKALGALKKGKGKIPVIVTL
jgi:hypothetical protein